MYRLRKLKHSRSVASTDHRSPALCLVRTATAGHPVVPLSGPAPGSISAVVRDTVSMQVHSTQTTPAVVSAPTWIPQAPSRSISPSDSVPSPSSASALGDGKEVRGWGGGCVCACVCVLGVWGILCEYGVWRDAL